MQQSNALWLPRVRSQKDDSFQLGHSSGCLLWESCEEAKTYHMKRPHGKAHLEINWGIQPIPSITYQAYKWMILKMVPAPSFRATHLCPVEQRWAIHSVLCLFSSWGFMSRGPVSQDLKPRNHTGRASFSPGPKLDDEILDFQLMPQWDETWELEEKAWVYFAGAGGTELLWTEGILWRLYFSACNSISHSIWSPYNIT